MATTIRWPWKLAIAALLVIGGVVAIGSRRQPTPMLHWTPVPHSWANDKSPGPIRLATFNIHRGRDADGKDAIEGTVKLLGTFHIAALNEVDPRASERLERAFPHFIFAASERRWFRESFGNGVMSIKRVNAWRRTPLVSGRTSNSYRSLAEARIDISDGRELRLLVTHIERDSANADQVKQAIDDFLQAPTPCVLAGDFNNTRQTPTMRQAMERVRGAKGTWSNPENDTLIDWIFVRGMAIKRSGWTENQVSDHPLVWVELE